MSGRLEAFPLSSKFAKKRELSQMFKGLCEELGSD